jgi:hypothetical protein
VVLATVAVAARDAPGPEGANPAQFTVTAQVLRAAEKVPPLGANDFGRCGAVEWAANNFVHNCGNEPIYWRNLHRAVRVGPRWFEPDGPGTSRYALWNSGFLSGADLRIYRLVDREGKPLPLNAKGDYLDLARADHVMLVGKARILPEGSPGFPDGGWIADQYTVVNPHSWIRHGNLSVTDASGVENGRTYWYAVVAVGADNQESEISNEVSATPQAGLETGPHLLVARAEDRPMPVKPGGHFEFAFEVVGGRPPLRWQVVDAQRQPLALPAGVKFDPSTGRVAGVLGAAVDDFRLGIQVTDAAGRSDVRFHVFNPRVPSAVETKAKPSPPTRLSATAQDGCVSLTWTASPSPGVVAYRLKRSTAPAAKQQSRVYLAEGGPALAAFDYVVLAKRFDPFEMRYVNPRVRGIGNPMDAPNWHWKSEPPKAAFALVPHPQPVPPEMTDPGETCLEVRAGAGQQAISQTVFIGTEHGQESIWYGQLEPGKQYRLEVWLRQQGLAGDGAVRFSYGKAYPGIHQTFHVAGQWRRYVYDFSGPERPAGEWHFGHEFAFSGPGTLWMDNCRIFRYDRREDLAEPYVPNATVLDELLASQPMAGRKGAHRTWYLKRDATMASILSWHANSAVNLDWSTSVGGTMDMTLPMGLSVDLHTGPDPQSRMRPWLVLQHILHSEEDWLALVEYLAAPYDPQRDTPQAKPWAWRRYRQRGTAVPWTDEFESIVIEFGNETWHNGFFADWLGFRTFSAIHQGGPEYGFFARYLIENIRNSPYWKSQRLDEKIRFDLGGNYQAEIGRDGRVRGYVEEAMQSCPYATLAGHANYVGPKWETGDYAAREYNDHGVQETLLSFLRGPEAGQLRMMQARDALAKSHHAYDIVAYEGGPGGYALPVPGREAAQQVETNEHYGKSLAMAVGCLDGWMRSYQYGWTDQCFLGYGQGSHWNSHTPMWQGFRPCPAWQALALRNRFAWGDLVEVAASNVPMLQQKKAAYPLVGAYAMRHGRRWSVFVVSRKLDGRHDGADFGDGYTPVELRLPFDRAERIRLHKLCGDPRSTNREQMNVTVQSQDIPAETLVGGRFPIHTATGGGSHGLPPGCIYLYLFLELDKP